LDGIKIEIRRPNKSTFGRSRSVCSRVTEQDRKSKTEQPHWDYSALYGKSYSSVIPAVLIRAEKKNVLLSS
jgi:hypothetical protein